MATEKRLIDANALKDKFLYLRKMWSETEIVLTIDDAKIVDAVEVVHGHWISTTEPDEQFGEMDYFKCSVCGKLRWFETNYCPNCGADMRDGDGNED